MPLARPRRLAHLLLALSAAAAVANLLLWALPASLKPMRTRVTWQDDGDRLTLDVTRTGLAERGFVRSDWSEVWSAADPARLAAVRRAAAADPRQLYRPPPLDTGRPMVNDWGPMHVVGPDGVETSRTGAARVMPYHLLALGFAVPVVAWAGRRAWRRWQRRR